MIPLVDMHCHLLAGLDDGPRTEADALEMCRIAYAEGVRMAAATAHQNERWSAVTPEGIRQATGRLTHGLRELDLPFLVFPCAEVMVHPGLLDAWSTRRILSIADRSQYVLLEMPHNLVVDLRQIVRELEHSGLRPILAHPERHPEFLHEPGRIERLIQAGCLVQVSSHSITDPGSWQDARALKSWFRRGIVHLLGSDGHSPRRRPPFLADAYHQVVRWAGSSTADRVGSTNGMAILQGLPLRVPEPVPLRRRWLARFW